MNQSDRDRLAQPLPRRPNWEPSYAHSSRVAAEETAADVEGRVMFDPWDPLDGDGPRVQWVVIEEGKHPRDSATHTHRDSAGRPVYE